MHSTTDRPWPMALRALLAAAVFLTPVLIVWGGIRTGLITPLAGRATPDSTDRVRIVCSIPPLEGIARLLGSGDGPVRLEVSSVLPPGVSEHGFEVTPTAAASLARADIVLVVGAGLDPQVERAAARARPAPLIVRFSDVVGVETPAEEEHDHADPEHDHDHGGVDPHLWLDPVLVEQLVRSLRRSVEDAAIRDGLDGAAVRMQMDDAERRALEIVRGVDAAYRERLAPFTGRAIATHHAAFGRLAARYGLVVAAVVRTAPTTEPTPAAIAEVARLARDQRINALFIEPQSSAREAQRLAEAAALRVLVLDPLGRGDWRAMMESNLDALTAGLRTAP